MAVLESFKYPRGYNFNSRDYMLVIPLRVAYAKQNA